MSESILDYFSDESMDVQGVLKEQENQIQSLQQENQRLREALEIMFRQNCNCTFLAGTACDKAGKALQGDKD